AARVGAFAERRAAAGRTEAVLNDVPIEGVCRHVGRRGRQPQLLARHEPQQVAALAADRAVALDHLLNLALDLEPNPPTMTAALVRHASLLSRWRSSRRA